MPQAAQRWTPAMVRALPEDGNRFVAPRVEGRRPERWSDIKRLLLAVEVLSPGTARADRTVKRQLFQRVGVPDYWIVDVAARVVECWRPRNRGRKS